MPNYQPWAAAPLGWFIALIGLIVVIVLIIGGQMPFLPLGVLFSMAFLSRLL